MNKRLSTSVYFVVFATGLFSLVYQTVWQRYLTFLVGADSRSSVLILTVFLTALSVGYWLAGSVSHKIKGREIVWYGIVEAIIGLWGLVFPLLYRGSFILIEGRVVSGLWGDTLIAIFLTALPAVLMGATLPFLTQGLSQNFQGASRTHAKIYAINTFGACAGALLTGFYLINAIGLTGSLYVIGTLNLIGGLLAVYLGRKLSRSDQATQAEPTKKGANLGPCRVWAIYFVAACSGYLLVSTECFLIRLFSNAADGSSYSYPTLVTAFIGAVGLGAHAAGRYMRHARSLYRWVPVASLACWFVVYCTLPSWPYWDYQLKGVCINVFGTYSILPLLRFVCVFLVVVMPVTLSSMLLPFSFHFLKNPNVALGRSTGVLYTVSTLSTVVGGVFGGYMLFAWLGSQAVFGTYLLVMVAMMFGANLAFETPPARRLKWLAAVTIVILGAVCYPPKDLDKNLSLTYYFMIPQRGERVVSGEEPARDHLWHWFNYQKLIDLAVAPEGLVGIFEGEERGELKRMITINGRSNSGTVGTDYEGNALLSLLPYMITENPKRVLVIGIGTGVTIGAIAAQAGVEQVDVCEINQAVIDTFHHFDFASFDASKNPKVNVMNIDAVKHMMRTDNKYDIVVSIPSNFWVAGVENLISPEFYALADRVLNDGGTYVQWVPDYSFSERAFRMVARSFSSAFGQTSVWRLSPDDVVLTYHKGRTRVGSWSQPRLQESRLLEVFHRVSSRRPEEILLGRLGGSKIVKALATGGEMHSIDSPRLSFAVLKSFYGIDPKYKVESLIRRINSAQ